jgi:hypothetical protein
MKFTRVNKKMTKKSKIYSSNKLTVRTKINKKNKSKKRGGASLGERTAFGKKEPTGYLVSYSDSFGNFYFFSFDILIDNRTGLRFKLDIICNHNMPYAQEMVYEEFIQFCIDNGFFTKSTPMNDWKELQKWLSLHTAIANLLLLCAMIPKTTGDMASFMSLSFPICSRFKPPTETNTYNKFGNIKEKAGPPASTLYMCPIGVSFDDTDNEGFHHCRVNGWCGLDTQKTQMLGTIESLLPIVILNEFYTFNKFMTMSDATVRGKYEWTKGYTFIPSSSQNFVFKCLNTIESLLTQPYNQDFLIEMVELYDLAKNLWPWTINYLINKLDSITIKVSYKGQKPIEINITDRNAVYTIFRKFALEYIKPFIREFISEKDYIVYTRLRDSIRYDELFSNFINNIITIPNDMFRAGGMLWRLMDPCNIVNKKLCGMLHVYNSWSGHDITSKRAGNAQSILTNTLIKIKETNAYGLTHSFTWTRPGLLSCIINLNEKSYIAIGILESKTLQIETSAPGNCGTSRQVYRATPITKIKVNNKIYAPNQFELQKWDSDKYAFYKNLHGIIDELPLNAVGETCDPGGSSVITKTRYVLGPIFSYSSIKEDDAIREVHTISEIYTTDKLEDYKGGKGKEKAVEVVEGGAVEGRKEKAFEGMNEEVAVEGGEGRKADKKNKVPNLRIKLKNGVVMVITPLFIIDDYEKYCEFIQALKEGMSYTAYNRKYDAASAEVSAAASVEVSAAASVEVVHCKHNYMNSEDCKLISNHHNSLIYGGILPIRKGIDFRCFEYCESEKGIKSIKYISKDYEIITLEGSENNFIEGLKILMTLIMDEIKFKNPKNYPQQSSRRGAVSPQPPVFFYIHRFIKDCLISNIDEIMSELKNRKPFSVLKQGRIPLYKWFVMNYIPKLTEIELFKDIQYELMKLRNPIIENCYTGEEIEQLCTIIKDELKKLIQKRYKWIRSTLHALYLYYNKKDYDDFIQELIYDNELSQELSVILTKIDETKNLIHLKVLTIKQFEELLSILTYKYPKRVSNMANEENRVGISNNGALLPYPELIYSELDREINYNLRLAQLERLSTSNIIHRDIKYPQRNNSFVSEEFVGRQSVPFIESGRPRVNKGLELSGASSAKPPPPPYQPPPRASKNTELRGAHPESFANFFDLLHSKSVNSKYSPSAGFRNSSPHVGLKGIHPIEGSELGGSVANRSRKNNNSKKSGQNSVKVEQSTSIIMKALIATILHVIIDFSDKTIVVMRHFGEKYKDLIQYVIGIKKRIIQLEELISKKLIKQLFFPLFIYDYIENCNHIIGLFKSSQLHTQPENIATYAKLNSNLQELTIMVEANKKQPVNIASVNVNIKPRVTVKRRTNENEITSEDQRKLEIFRTQGINIDYFMSFVKNKHFKEVEPNIMISNELLFLFKPITRAPYKSIIFNAEPTLFTPELLFKLLDTSRYPNRIIEPDGLLSSIEAITNVKLLKEYLDELSMTPIDSATIVKNFHAYVKADINANSNAESE